MPFGKCTLSFLQRDAAQLLASISPKGSAEPSVDLILFEQIFFNGGCFRVDVLSGEFQDLVPAINIITSNTDSENDPHDDQRGGCDDSEGIRQKTKPRFGNRR